MRDTVSLILFLFIRFGIFVVSNMCIKNQTTKTILLNYCQNKAKLLYLYVALILWPIMISNDMLGSSTF